MLAERFSIVLLSLLDSDKDHYSKLYRLNYGGKTIGGLTGVINVTEEVESMHSEVYSDILLDHFMSPRNVGRMTDANGEGTCGDPECGDFLTIYVKIKNDIIEDIKYLVFGCVGAIATSSMTTVLAKGKTIEEARNLSENDIVEALGGLPENKKHCSNLGVKALRNAIDDFYKRSSTKIN